MQNKPEKTRKQIAKHNRNLSNVALSRFIQKIQYKAKQTGTVIEKTGEFQATTTICGVCGYKLPNKLDTNIRKWTCPSCGTVLDRDRNASNVIKMICKNTLPIWNGE